MNVTFAAALIAMAAAVALSPGEAPAQQSTATKPELPARDPARPKDPTANLPSDTGSQTTTPSGAVTGAGQPQGTTIQRDVGAPGGLERRARREARGNEAGGTGATGAGAEAGAVGGAKQPAEQDREKQQARPARQMKG